MTQEQLNEIIESHQHYLNKDIDGWENMRADLSYKNLSGLDLKESNLREANLNNVNLRKANLRNADLRDANLAYADLRNANLREANLCRAFCCYANMRKADLRNADFREANLFVAVLREANLFGANLKNATIIHAGISKDAKIDYSIACPEIGSFIGYKKAVSGKIVKIIKLQICEDAKRSSATTKKCRCSKALVLAIENIDGSDSGLQEISSTFDPFFIYRIGEIAEVSDFDDNRWNECAHGIHFFMDRQDAVEYDF